MFRLLSQCDLLRFTPATHFVSSPVKLLRKTHQEMDFHKENPKLAEELKFQRQDDFTGPQMKPSLLQSDRWSMTSRGMNDRLLCYHWWTWTWFCHPLKGDVRQRVESIFIGYRARIPVDWDWLAERAINVRYRTRDAAPQLVLSRRSQFLATASTLYLSLMGKLNIQPIKDGHVYRLQEAWERLIEFH